MSVGRFGFTGGKSSTSQFVRFREIEPGLALSVGIELNTVRISQRRHVRNNLCELARPLVKPVKNINSPAFIIGEVVHVRYKDPSIGRLGKEPNTL